MSLRNVYPPTGGVLLRDVQESDLPTLFEHQRDQIANEMAAFPPRDRPAFMSLWAGILADNQVTKKTILHDAQVAGNIVCFERGGERLIGYWIGRPYWGKGIASRALAEFLQHVHERPLVARVAKHNTASIRVLQKCGFTIGGEDKGAAVTGGEEVEEWIMKLE